jgi:hypothetical protein
MLSRVMSEGATEYQLNRRRSIAAIRDYRRTGPILSSFHVALSFAA